MPKGIKIKNSPIRGTTAYNIVSTSSAKPTIFDRTLAWPFVAITPKWVTPNAVTVFRFVITPFVLYFLWFERYEIGFALFLVAALSDMLDGALARTRNQITDWGKLFDPVADKLLIGSVAALVITRYLSVWLAPVIIAIEAALILGYMLFRGRKNRTVQAGLEGKIKTVLQCVGISLLLLYIIFPGINSLLLLSKVALYLGIFFGALSLFVYKTI